MNDTAICLITNNRPEYFSQCIDYLIQCNNIDKYDIITGEEPPSTNLDECFNKLSQYCNVYRNINKEQKFIVNNIKNLLEISFLKYEKVILIEEDIIVSKDSLSLCNNILNDFFNDAYCLSVCLFENNMEMPDNILVNKIKKISHFYPFAWATWKNRWENMKSYFNIISDGDEVYKDLNNWDSRVQKYRIDNNMYCINPLISRCSHISYEGTNSSFYTKEWHNERVFSPYGCVYLNLTCDFWIE